MKKATRFHSKADCVLFQGDCLEFLRSLPRGLARLVVTSPPYNTGKPWEEKRSLKEYLAWQFQVIKESLQVLTPDGSLCWQVGTYVGRNKERLPLDLLIFPLFKKLGLFLRGRIIWKFNMGDRASKSFSGRHETVLWFVRDFKNYVFNLDPVRVPQRYPGTKRNGKYICNPKGANPGDVWDIPRLKAFHPEKTAHPAQFPVELPERLILALTHKGDWVVDPFAGACSVAIAALRNARKFAGAEVNSEFVAIAKERIKS